MQYCLPGSNRQWDRNWERMLEDGTYMAYDEFLSNFFMDRLCIKDDEVFWRVYGKVDRQSSMLHIMVLLKFSGIYRNAAALQKIGHMMGILKGLVNDYVMQACNAIFVSRLSSGQASRNEGTSVAGSERLMVLLIALV